MEQGNAGGIWNSPCGACVARGESCVREDGKASCDGCRKRKVTCNLSGWKPPRAKAKRKGGSIIDSDEDAQGELELKWRKVDAVLVVEIQQPATRSLDRRASCRERV